MTTREVPAPQSMLASLSYPAYRLWFGGALLANVGTWMQRIAQDWLVLTRLSEDSGLAVGTVTALQFLPALLLGPYGGLLADRLPRRGLLILTQAVMGGLALGLGALVLLGHAQLWHVWCFAFALGVVAAVDNPVRQTFVAELVPAPSLPNAVGLNSASFNAARLVGPAVAGVAIAAVGAGWVFVLNGLSFAFTILALLLMRRRDLIPQPHAERGRGQVREGLTYVKGRSDLMVIFAVVGVVSAMGLNFQMTSAMMARTEFGLGAAEYGMAGSVLAIGSLSGALLAARRSVPRVRHVLVAAFAFGCASAVTALAPSWTTYLASSVAVGFCSLSMLASANAYVQTSTHPTMRGRVMSLYLMVLLGATPLGAPVVGWVGEVFGARWGIGLGSGSALVAAAVGIAWARRAWHVEFRYTKAPRRRLEVTSDADRLRVAA